MTGRHGLRPMSRVGIEPTVTNHSAYAPGEALSPGLYVHHNHCRNHGTPLFVYRHLYVCQARRQP